MKTCSECREEKTLSSFNRSSSTKDGYQNWCRECQKRKYDVYRREHPEKQAARWKRYYLKNRERMIQRTRSYEEKIGEAEFRKRWKLRNMKAKFARYGITEEEYNQFLETQKQKCGMCLKTLNKKVPRRIHIDHDHATGRVRGILCDGCNLFLGRLESPTYPEKLEQAQTYLRKAEKREIKNSR